MHDTSNVYRPRSSVYSSYSQIALAVLIIVFAADLYATDLPWDDTATTIRDSLTGPWAWALALIAMVVSGVTYIYGRNELSDIVLNIIKLVILLALVFVGGLIIEVLYGVTEDDVEAALLPASLVI